MADRCECTPKHLEPTFLRGAFLERWRGVSEDLRPPLLKSWAGPWDVIRQCPHSRQAWPWEVRHLWEEPEGDGVPASRFLSRPLAELVAALLPFRDFQHGYSVYRQAEPDGFPVELNGVRLGFIASGGSGQLRRLESALRVAEFLAASPDALAAVWKLPGMA